MMISTSMKNKMQMKMKKKTLINISDTLALEALMKTLLPKSFKKITSLQQLTISEKSKSHLIGNPGGQLLLDRKKLWFTINNSHYQHQESTNFIMMIKMKRTFSRNWLKISIVPNNLVDSSQVPLDLRRNLYSSQPTTNLIIHGLNSRISKLLEMRPRKTNMIMMWLTPNKTTTWQLTRKKMLRVASTIMLWTITKKRMMRKCLMKRRRGREIRICSKSFMIR